MLGDLGSENGKINQLPCWCRQKLGEQKTKIDPVVPEGGNIVGAQPRAWS
jgi:hypothetical protein